MGMIEIRGLSISYGSTEVLRDVSLTLPPGTHAAVMGPSGCGKTTLLRCIAGLSSPDSGSVRTDGRISMVFQEPRLFPWMTAADNINIVLPAPDAGTWLRKGGLAEAADKYPRELSGGMRQRLSILRALAYGGDIVLMDEPFKELDETTRREIAALIARETAGKTLVLVTHDRDDLPGLADVLYEYKDHRFIPR